MNAWLICPSTLHSGLASAIASVLLALSVFQLAPAADAGDLSKLRAEALSLVNDARRMQGLNALQPSDRLNSIAQGHAKDMLERNYYSHTSPEGETVGDRFTSSGGSRWKMVAENIARCSGCPVASSERVSDLHRGWMNSPGHRKNILAEGLESFGFGIIGENGKQFAVQTFSGPGLPLDLQPEEEPFEISPQEQVDAAARAINKARKRESLPPVETSEALSAVARRLMPEDPSGEKIMKDQNDLFTLLPAGTQTGWSAINVVAGGCGGCGAQSTVPDIRYFVEQWLEQRENRRALLGPEATHIGFSMLSNGEGRKIAIAVAGSPSK